MRTARLRWAISVLCTTAVVLAFGLACGPAATSSTPTPTPQKVTFQAGYLPQGNISFVAAYVAKEKGFFAAQGLDVTIEHSSGSGEQYQRLAAKEIQFTTTPGDIEVKQVADQGVPFVSITVFGHAGDQGLMVLDNGRVSTPKDLEGKKVGYKFFPEPWMLAMFDAAGVDQGKVELVSVGFDPRVLLPETGAGQVDAVNVFKSNEPDIMAKAGFPVKVFRPEDFDIHFLGQTYVTHADFIRDDPEMVRRFVRATMKGLEWAIDPDNRSEVGDIIMKYAGADADRDHNLFIFETEASYVSADSTQKVGLGYASPEEWQAMMDVLLKYKAIGATPALNAVWAPQFVESVYKDGKLVWP